MSVEDYQGNLWERYASAVRRPDLTFSISPIDYRLNDIV